MAIHTWAPKSTGAGVAIKTVQHASYGRWRWLGWGEEPDGLVGIRRGSGPAVCTAAAALRFALQRPLSRMAQWQFVRTYGGWSETCALFCAPFPQ